MQSSEPSRFDAALAALVARSLGRGGEATAPALRAVRSSDRLHNDFVVASLPAVAIGAWAGGLRLASIAADADAAGWQVALARALGAAGPDAAWPTMLLLGLLAAIPQLFVVAVVVTFWELSFAVARRRPVDAGAPMLAWLFVLLMPITTPPVYVALGATFAAVLGKHVFGGTGRYLVSPALLGALFVAFAYPAALGSELPPGPLATWQGIVADGTADASWFSVLLGAEHGALGASSALACALGAGFLVLRGAASARTVLGAALGLAGAALLASLIGSDGGAAALGWHWHLVLGQFAFVAAFVATDPTAGPLTPSGRWVYGALFGILTVTIRVLDPSHPEASLLALLIATLTVPLIDDVVLRVTLRRVARRRHG